MKRKTNTKLVCILAAFLMLSMVTFIPVTTAKKSEKYINNIKAILRENTELIEEYENCIMDYIAEHGSIDQNFSVPDEMRIDLSSLMLELSSVPGQSPQSGGTSDIQIWYEGIICHVKLWLGELWCVLFDSFGNLGLENAVVAAVAIILCLIDGELDPTDLVYLALAITIIDYGVEEFISFSQGDGVVAKFIGVIVPTNIEWVAPQ